MRSLVLFVFFGCLATGSKDRFHAYKLSGAAQGTTYSVIYYSDVIRMSQKEVDSIFENIDASLSLYRPGSLINRFNESPAGVKMDNHLSVLVRRSLKVSAETKGLSDVTVLPLMDLWGMGRTSGESEPDSLAVRSALSKVGYRHLQVAGDSLIKDDPLVRIDLNGIAQGYTVDVVGRFLERRGVKNYLVEIGGEIRTKGKKYPGGLPFTIGIETPATDEFEQPFVNRSIRPGSGAITTSGGYRKFRTLSNGKKISHLIDPLSGYPFDSGMISVTVVASDATTADAYDNALMGMGIDAALGFLRAHPQLQAYIIYTKPDGKVADTSTRRFPAITGQP